MRTAVTLAVSHKGKETLLAGRTVAIQKQKDAFRKLQVAGVHEEYSEVNYQESDGAHVQTIRLEHPDVAEARRIAQEKSDAEAKAQAVADAKAKLKAKEDALKKAQADFDATAKLIDDAAKAKAAKENSNQ